MLIKHENPMGFSETHKNPTKPKTRKIKNKIKNKIRWLRHHHARARALYSRRRRIQLMKNGVVGAAEQVVNGTV